MSLDCNSIQLPKPLIKSMTETTNSVVSNLFKCHCNESTIKLIFKEVIFNEKTDTENKLNELISTKHPTFGSQDPLLKTWIIGLHKLYLGNQDHWGMKNITEQMLKAFRIEMKNCYKFSKKSITENQDVTSAAKRIPSNSFQRLMTKKRWEGFQEIDKKN